MSSQRSNNQRYGSGSLSGSLGRGPSGAGSAGSYSKGYGSGLVSLGTTKKPRTASTLPERKLSVPKPVNLPSLRKENAGNDPNTQLVPSGGGGGWQKPEQKEETAQEPAPNLTAGSSWASAPSSSGVPSWQPPQPFPVASAAAPRGRSLNPHEYPSLSVAATAKPPNASKQPVPNLPSAGLQGSGNWDEDERKSALAPQARPTGESWADSRFEDDERPAYRPPWETNGRPEWRGPGGAEGPPGRGFGGDDFWGARGQPTPRGGGPPKAGGFDRFREVEDPTLFPPPPPPRHQPPPPPPPPRGSTEPSREEAAAEKKAFEEEIDRVMEEERQRRREAYEASRVAPPEPEPAEKKLEFDRVLVRPPPPPPPPPPPQLTPEEQQAATEAARQKAIALRKQREAQAEEADRLRKEAAAAKLKELEERIARKEALEREVREKSAAGAPLPSEVSTAVAAAAADVEETAAALDAAVGATRPASGALPRLPSRGSLGGAASSVEAEATSSVGRAETIADVDSQGGGGETEGAPAAAASAHTSWEKPVVPPPKALWQRKDRDGERESESPTQAIDSASAQQPAGSKGANPLFVANSGFGPGLVATSLGGPPEEFAAQRRVGGVGRPGPPGTQPAGRGGPSGPSAPATSQLSWRAVLSGEDLSSVPAEAAQQAAEPPLLSKAPEGTVRGRGRGRRERDQLAREDRQGSGGRGERGRSRPERGRGKGRSRQDAGGADDVSSASGGTGSLAEVSTFAPPDGRRPRMRGEGRGRGGRSEGGAEPRNRGRGSRSQQPQVPGGAPESAGEETLQSLPPGIPRAAEVVLPPVETARPPPPPAARPSETAGDGGWGAPGLGAEVLQVSQLSLGKPENGLSPKLDPVAPPMGGPDARTDRAIDRPIERPKSAAGVVGRPKSAAPDSVLPNGMPVLPNDLSLDGPADSRPPPSSVTFGFNPAQGPTGLAPGPFPGVFFPAQHSSPASNPWQQATSGAPSQPNLEAAVESFYKAGGQPFGGAGGGGGAAGASSSGFSQPAGSQAPAGLQFGAFGAHSFPQFGQLGTSFGQAPFIHTGKQPDWSTGPISSTPSSSGMRPSEGGAAGAGGFSRAQGMDAIVPSANIQKRSAQGPPGPPGLQRQMPGLQLGAPAGLQQHALPQVQPPPGLKQQGTQPGQFGWLGRTPEATPGDQRPPPHFGFLAPQPPAMMPGAPPGIGAPVHHNQSMTARESTPALPDNVFDTSDVRLMEGSLGQLQAHGQPAANGQARRNGDSRARGGGGGSGGGRNGGSRTQSRARGYGRTSRGMMPVVSPPAPGIYQQGGPPGVLPPHNFAPGLVEVNFSGSTNPAPPEAGRAEMAGPKRDARSGGGSGGGGGGRGGKPRGRPERGRGRDAKLVYVAQNHGSHGGGQPQ